MLLLTVLTPQAPGELRLPDKLFIALLPPLECDYSPKAAPATDDRLEAAAVDGDDVMEALIVISVDPVYEVQSTVGAENEDIAEDERLSFAGL